MSSRPGLTQRREGVQGRCAPLSLGYLQAGVVTMAPTAVDTMSSWCSFRFIEVDLVCNFEETEQYKVKNSEQIFQVNFDRNNCRKWKGCEITNDKFRNKTNSNYELKLRRDAAAGDRTRVLQIRNMKREKWQVKGGVALYMSSVSLLYGSTSGQASSGRYFCSNTLFRPFPESVHPSE